MEVRRATERLCEPLAVEDFVVQAMPDASPARWHLAHVSWFFETFVLRPRAADYRALDERYGDLFNSYYNGVGPQLARAERGTLSRPTVSEVFAYRAHVDKAMAALLDDDRRLGDIAAVIELGL
ncbi:MAG: ergothioneine biosynthesis protein EgtB, partial [Candidatus Rokuibacteriota bacterium]